MKTILLSVALAAAASAAQADVITDWNTKLGELITESRLGVPPAYRVTAIVQRSFRFAT